MMHAHHLPVTRLARYHTLGAPGAHTSQLWLACHGYGQLAADFLAGFRALEADDRLIVAPEALSRFYVEDVGGGDGGGDKDGVHGPESRVGATWMTREDRLTEIEDYVGYLEQLYRQVVDALTPATPTRTIALGFSQGTATVARWAARTSGVVDELVLWGGRLPPELDPADVAERWRRLRVTFVVGSRDRWLSASSIGADRDRLEAHGVETRLLGFEGGHRLDDGALGEIARGA